eukprot:9728163-Lingulodinium_polyedra.AAC.1
MHVWRNGRTTFRMPVRRDEKAPVVRPFHVHASTTFAWRREGPTRSMCARVPVCCRTAEHC